MNVFDFDDTIFDADSSQLFYRFCLRRMPSLLRYVPLQCCMVLGHKTGLLSLEQAKSACFSFLRAIPDVRTLLEDFYQLEVHRMTEWYLAMHRPDDVIISASPSFLVRRFVAPLGIRHILCTDMDPATGQIHGKNCKGQEKITRFRQVFGDVCRIDNFYTDSLSDKPLAQIASHAWLVNNKQKSIRPFS